MLRASPSLPTVQRSFFPYFLLHSMSPGALPVVRNAGIRKWFRWHPRVDLCLKTRLSGGAFRGLLQELQQQVTNLLRLFLLHPMAGAVDQMTADHLRTCACLHRLIYAGALIGSPVLFARDEARGHVDGAARKCFELSGERARGAAAIPLQPALKSGARIFRAVEGEFAVGQPFVGSDCIR